MRPALEVADIFRQHGPAYRRVHAGRLGIARTRVMRAIEQCRTAPLGGHVERCDACHKERISYNSCRNRHCPKCQSLARAQWLEDRQAELLECEYFHVVFTLPRAIAAMAYQNKRALYALLFQASAETLATIAADPKHLGAELGFISILHTWGQNLMHHPHVHCVVPGGGLSPDGQRWIACRPGFFLPVRVLSRLFRRLFLEGLSRTFAEGALTFHGDLAPLADRANFDAALAPLRDTEWVVYAKRPLGGPKQVLEYLGRYTHRVAISNHRLVSLNEGDVTFRWKDPSATDNKWEEVKRGGDAAIRRWIDEQLTGRSCTIVLVGAETASRRWVKYEIEKSWNDGNKGLFGIRIHRLLDHSQQATVAGSNPFDQFTWKDGRKLSAAVKLYDPPYAASDDVYAHISQNIGQ